MSEGAGHLFLVGFMGSGKTTIGRLLAGAVGWGCVDTDEQVVAREGRSIERIFAIEGTLIGLVGTILGVVAGISVTAQIAWVQRQIEAVTGIDTLPESVYQFSTLPAQLDTRQVAVAVGIAMVLALGATLLPSRQASRLDPVDALRYE